MSDSPGAPTFPMLLEEGVHRVVRKVRIAQAVVALGLAVVVLVAAAGVIARVKAPTDGGLAALLAAGALGIASLTIGLIVQRISEKRVTRSPAIREAAASYLAGCWIAGGLNLLAGVVTAAVIFANGVSNGLWLPALLVLVLNVTGSALTLPRVKYFRRMFYSPSLRYARL